MVNIDINTRYDELFEKLLNTKVTLDQKFPGEFGLTRTKTLLEKLGNPQEKIKIIHIAGTSGKGSTCFILNSLLIAHGFKVGLSLSPHLFDIRERIQINNQLISKEKFVNYLKIVNEKAKETYSELKSNPTFFEITVALAFLAFKEESVDYAIIETGLGGLLDATNTIQNHEKISVITKIGLDHTHILGNNLSKIAFQKIGIVNPRSVVFTTQQRTSVIKVFKDKCSKAKAKLFIVKNISNNGISGRYKTHKNMVLSLQKVKLSLLGKHQIENARLALSCLSYLSIRDKFILKKPIIIDCLENLEFDGRFSIMNISGKTLIFDGAHNPQKMRSLVMTLKDTFPNKKFQFLVGFKYNKDFISMIRSISSLSKGITITNIRHQENDSIEEKKKLSHAVESLKNVHFIKYTIAVDPIKALEKLIKSQTEDKIVITGSFYLISKMGKYFNKVQKPNNDLRR